jgi:hypothetical protein
LLYLIYIYIYTHTHISPLGSTAQLRPWPPPQSSSLKNGQISWRLLNNFLFYKAGLLAPRPTPTLEDQASVFISPRGRVAQLYPQAPDTHFSRLLRHAWVSVGLFLFPGHHTGSYIWYRIKFIRLIFNYHSLTVTNQISSGNKNTKSQVRVGKSANTCRLKSTVNRLITLI